MLEYQLKCQYFKLLLICGSDDANLELLIVEFFVTLNLNNNKNCLLINDYIY